MQNLISEIVVQGETDYLLVIIQNCVEISKISVTTYDMILKKM